MCANLRWVLDKKCIGDTSFLSTAIESPAGVCVRPRPDEAKTTAVIHIGGIGRGESGLEGDKAGRGVSWSAGTPISVDALSLSKLGTAVVGLGNGFKGAPGPDASRRVVTRVRSTVREPQCT